MNIIERTKAPTPKFFRKVRTVGLILAAVSASLLAAPVALPAVVVQVAGYLAVAGSVATAVAQTATEERRKKKEEEVEVVSEDTNHGEDNNKGG
ncbi:MAG TPA: hypothetical protein VGE66_08170 [Chitinophagaceae bacterium]